MAKHAPKIYAFLLLLSIGLSSCWDSSPLKDFCVADTKKSRSAGFEINGLPCKDAAKVIAADFKSSLLVKAGNTSNALGSALTIGTASSFPALNTQGLSFARIDYAKGGTVQPHYHPRASEVLFVMKGSLLAGFIDTNNKLFAETLREGEMFVFPQGMLHFIQNTGNGAAASLSSLDSQNPGGVLVAKAVFGAKPSVLETVLAKAFKISVSEVHSIHRNLSSTG